MSVDNTESNYQEVHRNPWFFVGNRNGYYTLEYDNPQNVVLPIVEDKYILMIKSIRPVINDTPWELPAGGSADGERPVETIRRELAEETGVIVDGIERFIELPQISEMPGRMPQLLNVFKIDLSMDEYESKGEFDNTEVVETELFSFSKTAEMIGDNTIYLAPVCSILSRYLFSRVDNNVFDN